MEELINELQTARLEKNLSLEDISEQTNIQIHLLEALEMGKFDNFAGEIYLKGVISSYARVVGLNPQEILQKYKQLKKGNIDEENDQKEQVKADSKEVAAREKREAFKSMERSPKKLSLKKSKVNAGSVLLYGAVILLLMVGSWYLFISEPDLEQNGVEYPEVLPPEEEISEPETDDEDNDEKEEEEEEEERDEDEEIEIGEIESSNTESQWEVKGAEEIEVLLEFNGHCWIDLYSDEENIYQEGFHSGDEVNVSADQEVRIRLGDPRVVGLFINDKEVEGLEDINNPHDFIITLDNE